MFFKNTLEETRAIAVVLAGLIWLVIPMAWTYLNDRVFYAHQMTWMTFRLQCVSTGLSTVGALVAATMVPSLTAFTLSIGQALAYVVTASVGFYGAAPPARPPRPARHRPWSTSSSRCPRWPPRWPCPGAIHTFLPDLGETRGVRGFVAGGLVLGVAGIIELDRHLGRRARPRGARDRRGARAVHAAAPTPLTRQCLLWAHTRRSRVVGGVRTS